jgi:hypothetical protein
MMAAGSVRNGGCARRNAANGADAAFDGSFYSQKKKRNVTSAAGVDMWRRFGAFSRGNLCTPGLFVF